MGFGSAGHCLSPATKGKYNEPDRCFTLVVASRTGKCFLGYFWNERDTRSSVLSENVAVTSPKMLLVEMLLFLSASMLERSSIMAGTTKMPLEIRVDWDDDV